jgi:hypothetical protein
MSKLKAVRGAGAAASAALKLAVLATRLARVR